MKLRLNKVMRLAALSAATTLGLAGQTHAALYAGVWDPLFGAQFTGLGWTAYGDLYVSAGCESDLQLYGGGAVSLNAGSAFGFGTGECSYNIYTERSGIRLQNVYVDFYQGNAENIVSQLFVGDYEFGDGYGGGGVSIDGETQFLTSIDFYGIAPTAFQTSYSTRGSLVEVPPPGQEETLGNLSAYSSSLSSSSLCSSTTPFTGYRYSARLGSAPSTSGLQNYCDQDGNLIGPTGQSQFEPDFVLRATDANGNPVGDPIIQNGPSQAPASVPEPGTLALAGLALAGAAAARRRKRS